jgi:hypothetical protein
MRNGAPGLHLNDVIFPQSCQSCHSFYQNTNLSLLFYYLKIKIQKTEAI